MRALLVLLIISTPGIAQTYTQRGFIEGRITGYPQRAVNDPARLPAEFLFRYEGFYKPSASFQVSGSIDLRADSHHQVERDLHLSWWDREQRRPLAEIRRLSGIYHRAGLTVELGKQFIRWGKADILNPTDRFAPRDFLTVVDNDFLGITAARVTYEKGADTLDAVWSPRLTPSRIPLPDQRWSVPVQIPANLRIEDAGAQFPGASQFGLRWNHLGRAEFSTSVYQGFNHLPSFEGSLSQNAPLPTIRVLRFYPRITMLGADTAIPLSWFTIKGEGGYFASNDKRADEYSQYVLQLERHIGEWTLAGGYAGEWITRHGEETATFAPDRGLTRTFLASAHYTIDTNRSLVFETAIRQNGDGAWSRFEYSHAGGQHWRATTNITWIRGAPGDFLGQYHRNSHVALILRYSF